MASYRIVCTDLKYPTAHRHIVSVGTGEQPSKATKQWTVSEVRAALKGGDVFYTQGTGGQTARVESFDCGCGYKTIRSSSDATTSNNLDYLRECSWQS